MIKRLSISLLVATMMFGGAYFTQTASADEGGMKHCASCSKATMQDEWQGERHHMRKRHMWRNIMALDLNDTQRAEIGDIRSNVMKELIRKRADERIAQIELREIMRKDTVDMGAVEAKLKQIESLKTDIKLSFIKAREEIKLKLTPEQRKKLKEMLKKEFIGHQECKMHGDGKASHSNATSDK